MFKKLYSIYDVKTGVYSEIMELINDGEAIRTVSMVVNEPEKRSMLARCPKDYRLDFLGEINKNTGEIITINAPKHVLDLAQMVKAGK